LILNLFGLAGFAQLTQNSFSGNITVFQATPGGIGDYTIQGTFNDQTGRSAAGDVSIGDVIWTPQGYQYRVVAVNSVAGTLLNLDVLDSDNVGNMQTGICAIMDLTPNFEYPVQVPNISGPLSAVIDNHFKNKVDNMLNIPIDTGLIATWNPDSNRIDWISAGVFGSDTLAFSLEFAGIGSMSTPIRLAQQGANANDVLAWNGSRYAPIDPLSITGDGWGANVVNINGTLTGNGTSGQPLGVNVGAIAISTDGITITGNGTVGDPLIASGDGNIYTQSGTLTADRSIGSNNQFTLDYGSLTSYGIFRAGGDEGISPQAGQIVAGNGEVLLNAYVDGTNTSGGRAYVWVDAEGAGGEVESYATNGLSGSSFRSTTFEQTVNDIELRVSNFSLTNAGSIVLSEAGGVEVGTSSVATFTIGTTYAGVNQNEVSFNDLRAAKTGIVYAGFGGDWSDLLDESLIPKAYAAQLISDSLSAFDDKWLATELPLGDVSINALINSFKVLNADSIEFKTQDEAGIIAQADNLYLEGTSVIFNGLQHAFNGAAFLGSGNQVLTVNNSGIVIPTKDLSSYVDNTWLADTLPNGPVIFGANNNPLIITGLGSFTLTEDGTNAQFSMDNDNIVLEAGSLFFKDDIVTAESLSGEFIPVMQGQTGEVIRYINTDTLKSQWVETSATIPIIGTYTVTFPVNIPQDKTELFITYDDSDVFGSYVISPGEYTITGVNQIFINNTGGFISQNTDRVYARWLE
jgi:hypothetical protein